MPHLKFGNPIWTGEERSKGVNPYLSALLSRIPMPIAISCLYLYFTCFFPYRGEGSCEVMSVSKRTWKRGLLPLSPHPDPTLPQHAHKKQVVNIKTYWELQLYDTHIMYISTPCDNKIWHFTLSEYIPTPSEFTKIILFLL